MLTLFKLTLSLQAVFRYICLKFTCPIPNSARCSHFPLWPWMGTAHSIWQTRDHTFLFFCFSGPTKTTRAFRTVLSSHGTALLCWPSWRCREVSHRSRGKKKKTQCVTEVVIQLCWPCRQGHLGASYSSFFFKLCLWQLGGKQRGGLQQGDLFFSLFGVV